ncbi:MAG: hypothetical protein WCE91_04700 [Nitrososphaeraceae archaeon]
MSESIGVCLYIQSDRDERYILMIKEISMEVLRDQPSEGANKNSSTTTSSLARNDNNVPTTQQENPVESNLQTLLEFKKMLQKEQQDGESKVQAINEKIDLTKKEIDEQRIILEDLRLNLKKINEAKDAEYPKFLELKNNLMELRNKMKTLDEKKGNLGASKPRKERFDMANLARSFDQIERDIQTKKLSKEEERKLVARSKETAVKLHALRLIHKNEDDYRNVVSKYEQLKAKITSIFNQKSEFGEKIGKLKESLEELLNLRETLYEDRRKTIREVRENGAKLDMVETQLNAIEYRRSHYSAARSRRTRDGGERKEFKQEAMQERIKRNKENQERFNLLKDAALRKMSNGDKLTFDEMKLIYGDDGTYDQS